MLPYLEVLKDGETEEDTPLIEIPNVVGMSIKEASKILKENKLEAKIEDQEGLDKENTTVKKQTPSAGIAVKSGNNVYLEY